jgi:hypothetical protein
MLSAYVTPTIVGIIHAFKQLSYPDIANASELFPYGDKDCKEREYSPAPCPYSPCPRREDNYRVECHLRQRCNVLMGLPSEQIIVKTCSHVLALLGFGPSLCNPQRFIQVFGP